MMAHDREFPEDFEAARPDLRSRLWTRAAVEQDRLRRDLGDPGMAELPCNPVGEHLLEFLAYGRPNSLRWITAEELNAWGVNFYEAIDAARRNIDDLTTTYSRSGENLFCFMSGDSYDASRLMLIDRIHDLELAGKPVAMVPNRERLYVTGSENRLGLRLLADRAGKALSEPHSLSGVPLILDNGVWADWMPPEEHPSHGRFRKLQIRWMGALYAAQKELMDAVIQNQGIDLFVADFAILETGDGASSLCVWSEGVDALLPFTEKVAFTRDVNGVPVPFAQASGELGLADWVRVVAVAGSLMKPTDCYPPRYRVREFPDSAALETIGLREL
jgi:hypothetical protein